MGEAGVTKVTMTVVIEGSELPGRACQPEADGRRHDNVHVAVRSTSKKLAGLTVVPPSPWHAVWAVPGDAAEARWEMPVRVTRGADGFDFGGPFVRGDKSDRHIGLVWGDVPGDGTFQLFRDAKLRFADVNPALIEVALGPESKLIAKVRLTDKKGNPICARLRVPDIQWIASSTESP
jgi:Family of unknown function (DUF5990)